MIGVAGDVLPPDAVAAWRKNADGSLTEYIGLSSALGIDWEFDYFISPTGSDSNNGQSSAASWLSLNKIVTIPLSAGQTKRVLIRKGLYAAATDYITFVQVDRIGATLDIVFERGCEMDGTAAGLHDGIFIDSLSAKPWTINVWGNGLYIHDYKDVSAVTSPNGIGAGTVGVINCYDVFVANCNDGYSAHIGSTIRAYRCTAVECIKAPFINVNTSTFEAYNSFFAEKIGGSSSGLGGAGASTVTQRLYDCTLLPNASGSAFLSDGTTLTRCRIGTLTRSVTMSTVSVAGAVIDSFVNVYADGDEEISFDRCFGKLSSRMRNGGDIDVTHCVIVSPASGKTKFLYADFDPGSSSVFTINNNIFVGAWTFDDLQTAAKAGYMFSVGSVFRNNILYGGVAMSALLLAAGGSSISGTITDAPLIGSADNYDMSAYAFGTGSPALTAGYGGGDIGYSSAESDNHHIDKTLKLSPEIISGSTMADYVLKWAIFPELLLSDDGTIYTTFVPNPVDMSLFVDTAWMRAGSKGVAVWSRSLSGAEQLKADRFLGN